MYVLQSASWSEHSVFKSLAQEIIQHLFWIFKISAGLIDEQSNSPPGEYARF